MTEAKEDGKMEATLQVALNGGVQESASSFAFWIDPRAARANLLADLKSP
jgi:hypothetical protein